LNSYAFIYIDPQIIDNHIKQLQLQAQQQQNGQQAQVNRAKVDTGMSDMLLSAAVDSDYLQNQTAETLTRQGEQLNRIGQKIDGIENSLDRAHHLLRGVESCRYYVFGTQKNKNAPAREQALKNKTASAAPGAPPAIELDILFKKQDDSVLPAILLLDEKSFSCIEPRSGKLIDKNTQWQYSQIEQLIMRARHEHMDVRFKGTGPPKERRLRLMSSYLQVLTNQLWSRATKAGNAGIKVEFEPLVRKFDYKDERVLFVPPSSREAAAGGASGFVRNAPKVSSMLSDSSAQTQQDMDYVENNLDQVLQLTKGMNQRGQQMNEQLARQNEVLNNYNQRVDGAISRTSEMNGRLDHQIDKY